MVQYHCEATSLFHVPPEAFHPPPKVDSSIVRLIPYHELPCVADDYKHFAQIVKQAFSQRRKTLRNCLKTLMTDADWIHVDMDSTLRPEQLSTKDYVKLSNTLLKLNHE
jgi:16S rRNA (adenine1518-N6/adenine1519-N6)-dimethyltransferase